MNPSPAHLDLEAPQETKDHQGLWGFRGTLDKTVKIQFPGPVEILAVQEQMESQGVLVTWGSQVQTLLFREMTGTMGTRGSTGHRVQREPRGSKDHQAFPEIQD